MENKLEQLLNSLIEKGWKPRGKTGIDERDGFVYMNKGQCIRLHKGIQANNMLCGEYNLRELVSKESGLWQFVCQKKLATARDGDWLRKQHHVGYKYADDTEEDLLHATTDFLNDYRLIESALRDESELENFLLQNIKVGNED